MNDIVLSDAYMAIAEKFEGLRFSPYLDSAGKWTIGIGHLIRDYEVKLYLGGMSFAQATALFKKSQAEFYAKVAKLTVAQVHALKNRDMKIALDAVKQRLIRWGLKPEDVPPRLVDLLVDLAFNAGPGSLDQTIAAKMRARDWDGVIYFSAKFNKAEHPKTKHLVPCEGLTLRRFSMIWFALTGESWRIGGNAKTRWDEVASFLAKVKARATAKGKVSPLPFDCNLKKNQVL